MALVRTLPQQFRNVLVVGHNPGCAEFAASFAGAGAHAEMDLLNRFFCRGLAVFRVGTVWGELMWKSGELLAFLG